MRLEFKGEGLRWLVRNIGSTYKLGGMVKNTVGEEKAVWCRAPSLRDKMEEEEPAERMRRHEETSQEWRLPQGGRSGQQRHILQSLDRVKSTPWVCSVEAAEAMENDLWRRRWAITRLEGLSQWRGTSGHHVYRHTDRSGHLGPRTENTGASGAGVLPVSHSVGREEQKR